MMIEKLDSRIVFDGYGFSSAAIADPDWYGAGLAPPIINEDPIVMDTNDAHVYGHDNVSLAHVMIKGVYLVPNDRAVSDGWADDAMNILPRLEKFHEREFGGLSEASFELYGSVVGNRSTSGYRQLGNGFYHDMVSQVRNLDRAGKLGTPLSQSDAADPSVGAPTMTVYLIFADWGLEDVDCSDVTSGNPCNSAHDWLRGKNYFVGLNAPAGSDLNDIQQAGGSRGGYRGTDSVLGPYGAGIVTEEAWKHPEIDGTAIVAYHEGLGHSLGMPHPSLNDGTGVSGPGTSNLTDFENEGVMGQGMYRTRLENSYVEPSILYEMVPSSQLAPFVKDFRFITTATRSMTHLHGMRVTFSEEIVAGTLAAGDVEILVDPVIPFRSPFTVTASEIVAGPDGRQFDIMFPAVSFHAGTVEVTIGEDIQDLHGDLMDHDRDRNPGEWWDDRARYRFSHWPDQIPTPIEIDPSVLVARDLAFLSPEALMEFRVPIPDFGTTITPHVGTAVEVLHTRLADDVFADMGSHIDTVSRLAPLATPSAPVTRKSLVSTGLSSSKHALSKVAEPLSSPVATVTSSPLRAVPALRL